MKIKAKLVSFVTAALVVPLLFGIFYIRHFGRSSYQNQQGIIHLMIAEDMASMLQDGVQQKFQQVLNRVASGRLASLVGEMTVSSFSTQDVQQVESIWAASTAMGGIQRTILSNPLSGFLGDFQQVNPEFAEIMMTDRHGRLIGATNPTTDYWQADESWWVAASNLPAGSGRIQGLLYDESSGLIAIDMVFPVYSSVNSKDFLGVLKVSLNATRFLQRATSHPLNKAIARDIIFPDGRLFAHINLGKVSEFSRIPEKPLRELLMVPERWATVELIPGAVSLAAVAPIQIGDEQLNSGEGLKDVSTLYVLVSRDLNEAMMPVQDMLRQMTIWGVVAISLIAVLGYLLATYWFVRPIKKLRKASVSFVDYIKLSEQGRFEDSWESRQKVRQRMNELETIRSRDELQGLSSDFIRMGERMLIFFRQIEEKLTDKKQK